MRIALFAVVLLGTAWGTTQTPPNGVGGAVNIEALVSCVQSIPSKIPWDYRTEEKNVKEQIINKIFPEVDNLNYQARLERYKEGRANLIKFLDKFIEQCDTNNENTKKFIAILLNGAWARLGSTYFPFDILNKFGDALQTEQSCRTAWSLCDAQYTPRPDWLDVTDDNKQFAYSLHSPRSVNYNTIGKCVEAYLGPFDYLKELIGYDARMTELGSRLGRWVDSLGSTTTGTNTGTNTDSLDMLATLSGFAAMIPLPH